MASNFFGGQMGLLGKTPEASSVAVSIASTTDSSTTLNSIHFDGNSGNGASVGLYTNASDSKLMFGQSWNPGSGTKMTLDMTNGRLGINTTSPSLALEVVGDNQPILVKGTGNGAWVDYMGSSGTTFSMGRQGPNVFQLYNRSSPAGLWSVDSTGIQTWTPTSSLGTTQWSTSKALDIVQSCGNVSHLEVSQVRTTAGADWTYTGTRIQQRIDSTYQGYLQFNGTAGNYGVSIGTGGGTAGTQSAVDSLIISSAGDVSVPRGELSIGLTGGYSSTTKLNIATAGKSVPLSGAHGRTNYGDIHLEPTSGTSTYGNAITFGARDTTGVQAHIGTQSDGGFGTKMVFGTTQSYATGSQVRMTIDHLGNVAAVGDVTAYSDARLKSDVVTIEGALGKVSQLRGVDYIKDGKPSTGVIAQEVEAVIPEVVHTADDEMGTKSVAYGNMAGLFIEAIKELKAEVATLKAEIAELKK